MCGAVVSLYKQPRTKVFARRDVYARHLNVLVYLPRERYSASVASSLATALQASSGATHVSTQTLVADGPLARVYLIAHAARYPLDLETDIEQPLLGVLDGWHNGFAAVADAVPDVALRTSLRKLCATLPLDYVAATAPAIAFRDLDTILRNRQYKLCGILNGIDVDVFNPATDPDIPQTYDANTVQQGKPVCKAALQDEFGLNKDGSPVMAMVTRLVGHKGVDLVRSIAEGLLQQGIELVILGSGEAQYENFFNELCARNPGRVGVYIGFNAKLAQRIYAGADIFLMPSRSEPCGLAQMVSCRYGTIPVVRETGGLRDSIHDSGDGYGNGFTFANYNAHELYEACWRAKEGYWNKEGWPVLVKRAMECDFSWSNSAKSYEGLYNEVVNLW